MPSRTARLARGVCRPGAGPGQAPGAAHNQHLCDNQEQTAVLPERARKNLIRTRPLTQGLQERVENPFDEHYENTAFHDQPGRSFYLTLRYQPCDDLPSPRRCRV